MKLRSYSRPIHGVNKCSPLNTCSPVPLGGLAVGGEDGHSVGAVGNDRGGVLELAKHPKD